MCATIGFEPTTSSPQEITEINDPAILSDQCADKETDWGNIMADNPTQRPVRFVIYTTYPERSMA